MKERKEKALELLLLLAHKHNRPCFQLIGLRNDSNLFLNLKPKSHEKLFN